MFQFIFGGLLAALGFIGMAVVIGATFLGWVIAGISGMSVEIWPSVIVGIISFVIFLAGVYLMRSSE